jgi:hypothetical protein
MKNKSTIYIVILVAILLIIIIVAAAMKPKSIDWAPTYATKDKIPLGLYVFDKEAHNIFKGDTIQKIANTPYEFFENLYDYEAKKYTSSGSFININEINEIDSESAKELLYFADHGNTIFLSMKSFPQTLLDSLSIKMGYATVLNDSVQLNFKDSIHLALSEKHPEKSYLFKGGTGETYFDSLDTENVKILGYQGKGKDKHPDFIEVPYGYGRILLHTQPAAFSNYHLLKDDHYKYAEDVLSYIPKGKVFWYYKTYQHGHQSDSIFRYILSQPALKWGFWLSIIAFLIFIFFNAKRRQRIIPEISPVRNTTVDFAKTIGNLYFQEGDHHTIIEKKIIFFLEHIRNVYLIDTYSLDNDFVEKLHLKTGKPIEDIQKTVSLIKKHRHEFKSNEADVLAINKAIENLRL